MTEDRLSVEMQQRNPRTQEVHRRQAFWQIYFPLIVFGVLVVIAVVFAILAEDTKTSKWSDISLIFMISITLIVFVIVIGLLVVSIVYTRRLLKATPYFFFSVQRFTYMIEIRTKQAADMAAEPFLRLNEYIAGLQALRRK
ncbi:MAG: hypothetical protein JSV42_10705 [Chloroflexota bacterium]|nr:MAG: hypothetical protein JSV42_10705 [Chloroflexota bacterium]